MTSPMLHPAALRSLPDEDLVDAIRAGAGGAVDVLHDRYAAALLGYARSLLGGSHHDAEECVQDAFVRALRALVRDPDRDIALKAWLHTIVRNACLDRRRGRGARPTVDIDDVSPTLAVTTGDPHSTLVGREALAAVVAGLRGLPERQRAALVGLELEGRSHAEIAGRMGLTSGASKALVHRARTGLQAATAA